MNDATSSLLLLGVGTAGAAMARGVKRASGDGVRLALADTDASTGSPDAPFVLLGGDRLSGRGSGGDIPMARLAAEDSTDAINDILEGVSLAIVVTALGGGTGSGATPVILRHLADRGVTTIAFATIPFAFEGEERRRAADGMMNAIVEYASASFILPLDRLVADAANGSMEDALKHAIDTLASGVTLFWRLLDRPGYIRLDIERMRRLVARAGSGRFAVVTTQGENRATDAVDALSRSTLLTAGTNPIKNIVCGVLAGNDLRLAEVGQVADGVRSTFGERAAFTLGTVNDEATFSRRLTVVILLFEAGADEAEDAAPSASSKHSRRGRSGAKGANPLAQGPQGRGRFNAVEPTVWRGEDLDTPTYIRRKVTRAP